MGDGGKSLMRSIAIAEAKAKLSSLVDEVRTSHKAIEIRRRDQPAAYLVEVEMFRRLQGIEDSVRALQLREAMKGERFELKKVLAEIKLGL
jgi:prevent-host-death family protein